jgi:hypothetical protein
LILVDGIDTIGRVKFGWILVTVLVAAGCSDGSSPEAKRRRLARDAAAGRTAKYHFEKVAIFKEVHKIISRRFTVEKEIRADGYVSTKWIQRSPAGQTEPDRIRAIAEVLGPELGPCRVRILVEHQVRDPDSGQWVAAGFAMEEEDLLYAELHRAMSRLP